ncbi:hypothetical protein ACHAXT_003424 [Thalassiosira profunda]
MRVLIGADGQPAQTPNNPRPPKESSSTSRSSPPPEEEGEGEPPRKKPKGDDISGSDGDCQGSQGPVEARFKSEEGSGGSSSSSSSGDEEIMGGGGRLASSASGPEAAAKLQGGGGVPGEEEGDGQRERRRAEGPGEDEGPRATAAAASPHRSAPPRARPRGDRNPEDDDDEWHDDRGASRCIFLGKSHDGEGRRTCGDDDRSPSARGYGKSGRSGLPPSSSSLLRPSAAAAPAPLLNGPVPGSADDPATVAKSDRPFDDGNRDAEDGRTNNADDDAGEPTTLARFVRLLRTRHRPPLDVVAMDGDGNCLFRALALQVYGDPSMHAEVRRRVLDFMAREADHFRDFVADEDFAQYVARKREDGVHGNHAEIQAASELYCRSAEVYVPRNGLRPINIFHSEYAGLGDAPLRLLYTDGNHYDAVVDPLVPTAGLGLGLPGLQPGLADRMQVAEATQRSETSAGAAERRQLEEATKMSERARKEREDAEVREALAKSAGDMATVKTPYYAGDSDEERMYQKKALYLSEIEAADFDLEQAVLASSLESYHRAEHERKPSSSMRRGDAGRRSRCNASPRGLRSSSNSPVHRTAAAASAAASPSSHPCAAASAAAAASSAAASLPSASSQPTAAGLNNGASLTTDEYPPSVQELVMNGFEPSKVLRAYDLVGDSFDDLLSVLLSSTATAPHRARPRSDDNPEDDDDEWHDDRGASRCIFLGKSNDGEGRRTCGDDDQSPSARGYGKSGRSGLPPSSSSLLRPSSAAAPAPLLHGPVPGSADDPATVAKTGRPFDDGTSTAEDGRNAGDSNAAAPAGGPTLARFVRLLRTRHRPPLDVVAMDGDGNCLFRALALQVYGDPSMHAEVRRRILDFMEREADHFRDFVADEDFAQYVARKRGDGVHGNHAEIQAASELYCRSAEVYVPRNGISPINIFHSEYAGLGDAPLRLLYTDGNHYDAVVDPLVPTAGLGLGLPGLQPGLADRMQVAEATQRSETSAGAAERRQLEEATRMSERARKEREDSEVREALKKSAGDMATVKTPYYAGDSDEERMYQKKALYLSEIEAADFDLEQAVLASSLESYHRAEHERKPSSSIRRGDGGRRSRCNASPRGLRSSSNSPVHRTAAAASAAASPSSQHPYAAASAAAAPSSAAASLPSASSQPTAAGWNNSASLTTDEYPPSVQELVMNGFELPKVLRAYDLVGDSFDDLLSVLLSSTAT